MTEQQTAEQPVVDNAPKEFLSFAELAAEMEGKIKEPEKIQAKQEALQEQSGELEDEESSEDTEEQAEEAEYARGAAEQEPEVEKKRSKYVPRNRFDEVTEQKNTFKSEAERLRNELALEREKAERLLDFVKKSTLGADSKEQGDKEEILDEALDKKLSSEIENLKMERAIDRFQYSLGEADRIGRSAFEDYDAATNHLIASEASQMMTRAEVMGKKLDKNQAVQLARQSLAQDFFQIQQNGGDPSSIAAYAYKQAQARGFSGKKESKQAGSKIDMKQVQRAREEAGAPTIARESVKITGGNWQEEMSAMARKDMGDNHKSLKHWGL